MKLKFKTPSSSSSTLNSIPFYRTESLPLSLLLLIVVFSIFFFYLFLFSFLSFFFCSFNFFLRNFFFFFSLFYSYCKCLLRSFQHIISQSENSNINKSIILFQCLTIYSARNLEHNTGAFGDSVVMLMATLQCDSKDSTRVIMKER